MSGYVECVHSTKDAQQWSTEDLLPILQLENVNLLQFWPLEILAGWWICPLSDICSKEEICNIFFWIRNQQLSDGHWPFQCRHIERGLTCRWMLLVHDPRNWDLNWQSIVFLCRTEVSITSPSAWLSVPDCLLMNCWLRLQFVLQTNQTDIKHPNSGWQYHLASPKIVTTAVILSFGSTRAPHSTDVKLIHQVKEKYSSHFVPIWSILKW